MMDENERKRCRDCGEYRTHVNGDCIVCTVAQRTAERRLEDS